MIDEKWDKRFLKLAEHVSAWSKDPSTKTGAVITDKKRRVVSVGYNGFPRKVKDTPERYNDRKIKIAGIAHCERNAIIFARQSLEDCTLYTWPFMSCAACASMVIQAEITRCVAPPASESIVSRWGDDIKLAAEMFDESGVELSIIKPDAKVTPELLLEAYVVNRKQNLREYNEGDLLAAAEKDVDAEVEILKPFAEFLVREFGIELVEKY